MMLDESTRSVPRLCGGIFLSLLEAAKKSTSVLRKQFGANGSGISMADMLTDLTRIADPSRSFPALENLKSSVSNYRMCAISKTGHFPFDDQSFVNTFADRMAQNYETVLAAMRSFVEKYFDLENTFACQRLVKSLVETIAADASIAETEAFTYMEGKPVFKAAFCNKSEYDLAAFLLAVWFFVIQKRPDNSIGKDTFQRWHTQNGSRGPWKYIGNAGATITRTITVYMTDSADAIADELPIMVPCDSALSLTKDIDRLNELWASVMGTRLEPIKKTDEIAPEEMAYVYPLYAAYSQNLKRPVRSKADLSQNFQMDLEMRRQHFYDAETVRLQGEQALGSIIRSEFEDLKNDILSSVWNTYIGGDFADGFKRMVRVMDEASKANCTKGNLVKTGWIGAGEKQGIGHMLAAEKQLIWAVDDNA